MPELLVARQTGIGLLTRPDANYIRYQGIDAIFEGRPSPNWDLYAAYTLSFRYGPGIDELGQVTGRTQNFNPREVKFFAGYAPGDIRHQFRIRGSFLVSSFEIGLSRTYLTGTPRYKIYQVADPVVGTILRSPIGTQPSTLNDLTTVSEFRVPDVLTANLRAQYDFYPLLGRIFTQPLAPPRVAAELKVRAAWADDEKSCFRTCLGFIAGPRAKSDDC